MSLTTIMVQMNVFIIHPLKSITKLPKRNQNPTSYFQFKCYQAYTHREKRTTFRHKNPRHLKHNYPIGGRHLSDNPSYLEQDMHRVSPICKQIGGRAEGSLCFCLYCSRNIQLLLFEIVTFIVLLLFYSRITMRFFNAKVACELWNVWSVWLTTCSAFFFVYSIIVLVPFDLLFISVQLFLLLSQYLSNVIIQIDPVLHNSFSIINLYKRHNQGQRRNQRTYFNFPQQHVWLVPHNRSNCYGYTTPHPQSKQRS